MIKRIFLALCLAVVMVFFFQGLESKVCAAEIGKQLLTPEEGWQRIDNANNLLCYSKEWRHIITTEKNAYKKTWSECTDKDKPMTMKFKGTKFRIIGAANNNRSTYYGSSKIKVTIDDSEPEYYSGCRNLSYQILLYEKVGLENKEHTVTIENTLTDPMWLDAIDIDEDGELLDANPTKVSDITLNKSDITMNAEDTEDLTATILPEDAANKEITWTSSDEKVCTVDENGKVTAISPGTAVVTATAKDGSGKTASCNVTVVDNRRGVLTINMTSGKEYSYDMSMDEINNFVNWYEGRIDGEGSNYYVLKVTPSSGAYNTRTHHLNFNNISDFIIETYK